MNQKPSPNNGMGLYAPIKKDKKPSKLGQYWDQRTDLKNQRKRHASVQKIKAREATYSQVQQ